MTDIDSNELLLRWKNGKTLYESLFAYSDASLRNEYNQSHKDFQNKSVTISKKNTDGSQSIRDGIGNLLGTVTRFQETERIKYKLQQNILNKILSEKIITLGFEAPINSSSFPEIIPIYVWPRKTSEIDWSESSFSKNGIEYLNIRVVDYFVPGNDEASEQPEPPEERKEKIILPDTEIADKPIGRPTIKELIIEAYERLKAEGRLDFTKTLKPHTQLIQDTVRILDPSIEGDKNMGYKTIYSHLGKRFNADKDDYQNRL